MEKSRSRTEAIWVAQDPEGKLRDETRSNSKAECYLTALRLFDLDQVGWKIVHVNKPTALPLPRKRGRPIGSCNKK